MVERHVLSAVMETVAGHLSAKQEPMADGYCMVQLAGEVEAVTRPTDILSLRELLNLDRGSTNKWQTIKY